MNGSRRVVANEALLKAFLSLVFVLIVVYWPAIMIYLFVQTILVGIHGFVFPGGYKGALARGSGYVALGVSAVAGVAVFFWETAMIIAAITRNL
jgi:hypothetical protein